MTLYYFHDIDRNDLIKATTATLQRQNNRATLARLKPELDQMYAHFRATHDGDRCVLNLRPRRGWKLEINNQEVFSSRNDALAKAYPGMWLAPKVLYKDLRQALLD